MQNFASRGSKSVHSVEAKKMFFIFIFERHCCTSRRSKSVPPVEEKKHIFFFFSAFRGSKFVPPVEAEKNAFFFKKKSSKPRKNLLKSEKPEKTQKPKICASISCCWRRVLKNHYWTRANTKKVRFCSVQQQKKVGFCFQVAHKREATKGNACGS